MELPWMSTNYFPPEFPIRYIPTLIRYASPEPLEKPLGSKNSEHQIPTFGGERHKNYNKLIFTQNNFFQDRTKWKRTSWQFQKCIIYVASEDFCASSARASDSASASKKGFCLFLSSKLLSDPGIPGPIYGSWQYLRVSGGYLGDIWGVSWGYFWAHSGHFLGILRTLDFRYHSWSIQRILS